MVRGHEKMDEMLVVSALESIRSARDALEKVQTYPMRTASSMCRKLYDMERTLSEFITKEVDEEEDKDDKT